MQRLKGLALAVATATACAANAQVATLTGINWFTTDASKNYTGGYANTYGGDSYSRNLYITENQAVGSGPLLNSANLTTLPTRIQIDLSQAGDYSFQLYCNDESTNQHPWWGLNLFFNGDDRHAGISAWNVANQAGFQTLDPVGTPTLDPYSMGLVQSGSNQGPLVVLGSTKITLTSYETWAANHYNVDRVDNFSDDGGLGNGTKDNVIEFSIHVAPVPEPCTLLALGGGTLLLMRRRRASH